MNVLFRAAFCLCCLAAALLPGLARAELLSAEDRQLYRSAFAAAKVGDWGLAWQQASQARDASLHKALRWLELTKPGGGPRFFDAADFLDRNPDWPGQVALRQRAEEGLLGVPDSVLRDYFQRHRPVTPTGRLRQAELMLAASQRDAAVAMIRDIWINGDLNPFEESAIQQRHGSLIRREDDVKRLDRLLWDNQDEAAKRMFPRVPAERRLLADARIKLANMAKGAEGALAKVPRELQSDPGLLYERARWRRRKELYDSALQILLNPPKELGRAQAWWAERQILARRLLGAGDARNAYKLVAKHGLDDGQSLAEAEFLAGWIQLRFLQAPERAYEHFVHLYDKVKLPISVSRGAYWAGRAAEARGMKALAASWYQTAAEHVTTYYGQLAAERLGREAPQRPPAEPAPSPEDVAAFNRAELVRVARMLHEIGETAEAKPFLLRLSDKAKSPGEHALVTVLAEEIGRPDLAVSAAKRAGYAGIVLLAHGYPLAEIPGTTGPERPLLLAMARQESAFDREAVSRAGARGLMQLMPGTAAAVARSLQLPYSPDRLYDPAFNVTLGKAYLDSLLGDFSGSYVLAIAAYNAGPTRVRQWLREYGDPRGADTDAVDWIESIPFSETRNYVQRVLENLQVYRLRLGDHRAAFSLASDLRR